MKSRIRRRSALTAFIILTFCINISAAATSQSIEDAKAEKEQMESAMVNAQKILDELKGTKNNIEEYVVQLDSKLGELESDLATLTAQLTETQEEITKTQKELEQAKAVKEKQYSDMKKRIKYMYENGNTSYMEMVLDSKDLSEALNKAEYVAKISEYDRNMLTKYQQIQEEIAANEELLKKECSELEVKQGEVSAQQASVDTLIDAKTDEISQYESQITDKAQLIKEYEADIAEQNRVIAALEEAARKAAEAAAANGEKVTYDGGMFAFPCPGYTRVSSDYGMRLHPTLGVEKFHNGIDLAAPSGTPILAAYNGTVVAADYNASMGNYVMINHGDGLYTIYMHASAIYVSAGQAVLKGDAIAAVGSTGRSTGAHLHFSVRVNGDYVSPWNYLG